MLGQDEGQLATVAKTALAPGANIRHRENVKRLKTAKAKRRELAKEGGWST